MTAPTVESAQAAADADLQPSDTPSEDTTSPAPADTPDASGDGSPDTVDVAETPPASDDPADTPADPGPKATDDAPDLSQYPAFTFRAAGGEHEYPGTHADEDGNVLFTKPAVEQLRRDLAHAKAYPKRDAEAQKTIAHERSNREAAEAALNEILSTFDQMFENGTWQDWAQDQANNWLKLKSTAQQKSFDLRSKAKDEELNTLRREREDREQRPLMLARVEEALNHWGKEAGLNAAELARLQRKYTADEGMDMLFPRATQDDPVTGLTAGQRRENLEPLRQELLFLHEILKGRTPAQAAADVKKENEKRTGKTVQAPPPVARVSGGTPAGTKPKTYKNTREADEDIWA